MFKKNWKIWFLIFLVAGLLFYLRTWFHGLMMFFYTNPFIFQVLIVTVLIHFFVLKRIPSLSDKVEVQTNAGTTETVDVAAVSFITPIIFVVLLIGGFVVTDWFRSVYIVNNVEYAIREDLPESSNNLRLMPYSVAKRYAQDSLQLSQYKLGTENIALIDDKMSWMFPLTPDGFVIQFLRQNKGMVYVDATEQSRNSEHVWQDMEIGEGMYVTDNLYWNIFRERYFVTVDDPYYLVKDDDIFTCLGVVSYDYKFKYGLLYTVPKFEGVFVVDTDGDIDLLTPEEALDDPVLSGNRIFPENLARLYIEAYEFHLGIFNKLFIHEDQIEIQDVFDHGARINRQPYLMDTEEGLKWFVSAEPYGASHGIFKIFIVDAETGNIELFELPEDQTLTGPVKSVDYVRRSNPVVDWNRFDSVEPLPFIQNQRLFWKLSVIPADSAGIAYQAFVDAQNNDVIELTLEEEIIAFLEGDLSEEDIEGIVPATDDAIIDEIQQKFDEIQELFKQLEL